MRCCRASPIWAGLKKMFPELVWLRVGKRDPRAVGLYGRHYSAAAGVSARARLGAGIVAPGESVTLLTADCSALFVWVRQAYGQVGVNCAVFRNEGRALSSDLILAAEAIAWARWPGERLFTYIDPARVRSSNPGYCFLCAGWVRCGWSKRRGYLILEKIPR